MQKGISGSIRFIMPPWPYLLINYCLPFLFLQVFSMVKISLKNKTLTVSCSMGKYYIEHIPLHNSISCQPVSYTCPIWHLIIPSYYKDCLKEIPLPGYSGQGIMLTYTSEKFFSGEKYTTRILIPTKSPAELTELITPFLPAGGNTEKGSNQT